MQNTMCLKNLYLQVCFLLLFYRCISDSTLSLTRTVLQAIPIQSQTWLRAQSFRPVSPWSFQPYIWSAGGLVFPASVCQGISIYQYKPVTPCPASVDHRVIVICVRLWPVRSFRTPSVVQRHLTAISFTPGHTFVRHLGV